MLKNILVIFSLVAAAYGSAKMTIIESPEALVFNKFNILDGKQLGQLFSVCTGHSISESISFKMQITSPFDLAEHVCLINIVGVNEFTPQNIKPKSQIEITGPEVSNDAFTDKLSEKGSSIVRIAGEIESLSALQDWCETPLKPENSNLMKKFIDEKNPELNQCLERAIVFSVLSQAECTMPNFLQIDINLSGFKSCDKYGKLIASSIEDFAQKFQKNANGKGLVAVLNTEEQPLKRSRRAPGDNEDLNLAGEYSEDYPVIFNIILWFGVLMVFSTLAIAYAIGTMDPGRDSIIYRMTSTRIKKDN